MGWDTGLAEEFIVGNDGDKKGKVKLLEASSS
jgi:hypothetical protein